MAKRSSTKIATEDSTAKLAQQKAEAFMKRRLLKNKAKKESKPPEVVPKRPVNGDEKVPVPKGTNNRPKRLLAALLEEHYPGYQPVVSMAHIAHQFEREAQIEHQRCIDDGDELMPLSALELYEKAGNLHEKVARYVSPQLKAVDLTSGGETIAFSFNIQPPKVINED